MNAKFISKEKLDVKFTMEFSAEEFEKAQIEAYKKQKGSFEISGFRKGNAPRSIIEKHYGEGVFFEDAINELFSAEYPNALDTLGLEVIESPRAEFSKIEKGAGFTVTITVATEPEVDVKDYKGVEIKRITHEVTDEDIQRDLEGMQRQNARIVSVDRAAKAGDTVILDYSGFVGDEQFEGGTAENQELKLGSGQFIPGFEEQLISCKAGDEKEVEVTFPEEYHTPELAGKAAVFKCKIHEVKEEQLPELDDDFAGDVSEFDTLDELKANIKEKLEKYASESSEVEMKNVALDKIVEKNEFDIPESMVSEEIERMVSELNQQLQYQGVNIQQYLEMMGKKPDEFKEEMKPDAEKRIKSRLVLDGIVRAEGIEATEEEINKELEEMGKAYGMDAKKVREMLGEPSIKYVIKDVKSRKAMDFVFDNAKIK